MMCLLFIACCATNALAQQTAPPQTIASVVDREISGVEKDVVAAAEAMPEDKYNFSPLSLNIKGGYYLGSRTFAQEVKHIATANYVFWAGMVGEKPPAEIKGPNGPESLKSKAEIVKFLKDSFALGHRAAATLTQENLLEQVPVFQNKTTRLYAATFMVSHCRDHYGQMVEYLRMNGIVPPATRGFQ